MRNLFALIALSSILFIGCSGAEEPADEEANAAENQPVAEQTQPTDEATPPTSVTDENGMELAVYTNGEGMPICPVMGSEIPDVEGKDYYDHEGTRYFLCCAGCESFKDSPETHLNKQKSGEEGDSTETTTEESA